MDYKEKTNKEILNLYRTQGIQKTLAVTRCMLESATHKNDMHFLTHVHGEICEAVLECLILDYLTKYNLTKYGWFYSKGLILKDVNHPDSGYFTELDLTVFTPQKIFAFECKSYGGDKKITDKCTIRKKVGGAFDVYDQHSKHFIALADQLKPFRIITPQNALSNPYQLILFNYSVGKTEDVRSTEDKLLMPCLDESNVMNIFKLNYNAPVMWDIQRVRSALNIIEAHSERNRKQHLKYGKNLRRERDKKD